MLAERRRHADRGTTTPPGTRSPARARLLAIAEKIPDPGYQASFLESVPENARTLALAAAWLGDPALPHPAGD